MLGHLQYPDRETLLYISRHLFQHHGQRISKHKTGAHTSTQKTLQVNLPLSYAAGPTENVVLEGFYTTESVWWLKTEKKPQNDKHSIKLFHCKVDETPGENNYCTQLYYLLRRAGSFVNGLWRWSLRDA